MSVLGVRFPSPPLKNKRMQKKLSEMSEEEFRKFADQQKEEAKQRRREAHEKLWNNLPKFEAIHQIPQLPQVEDPEVWKNFYVVKLIEAGAIPKSLLKDREYYIGDHRRAQVAQWRADQNKFVYMRSKFNQVFEDDCNHFEDDDGFSLFVPIAVATKEQFEQNQI